MVNFLQQINMINSMAVSEFPTPEARFELIVNASIGMAAKLRLDEAYINSRCQPMEVDGIDEQKHEVKPIQQQHSVANKVTVTLRLPARTKRIILRYVDGLGIAKPRPLTSAAPRPKWAACHISSRRANAPWPSQKRPNIKHK